MPESCTCKLTLTDRDLSPAQRTQANFWKLEYFKAMQELQKANKGIRRLRSKYERLKINTEKIMTAIREENESKTGGKMANSLFMINDQGEEITYSLILDQEERIQNLERLLLQPKLPTGVQYTVRKIDKAIMSRDTPRKGYYHAAPSDQITLCGLPINEDWYIETNDGTGIVSCPACIKSIKDL